MRNTIVLVLFFIGLVSCDSNRIFDEYQSVENNVWEKENIAEFKVEVKDTISKKNLFINIRNNKEYEFSNLFLIAKMSFPNGSAIVDTLEYEMTDKTGNFLGTGFTDIKENKLFYKENVRFNQKGQYTLNVEQAMRKNGNIQGLDSLKGITDIGFRIENIIE
ncbi:gliding motility lipoprotein GldH [Urechidicola croceus]|uniref:Gliding motility lipoprotein GldH n=1 Tax=Urechidicola croceus TaxID=1850246 RepID=A0A1D8P946_9FLAO|nr:gliding motility lipoprotein GldH [Urechidicola croceus]AOW21069.1 gliding motility lipoprotein GldH [Urechidicola croceus]